MSLYKSSNHRADFFQVFSGLAHPRSTSFEDVGRVVEHQLEQLGRRQPIRQAEPARDAVAGVLQDHPIFLAELVEAGRTRAINELQQVRK